MSKRLVITEEFKKRANELREQGHTKDQIARIMHCSNSTIRKIFGPDRLGINRANKEPWTLEALKEFQDCYKVLPLRQVCLKFNRHKTELRQLLYQLGWEIPGSFFNAWELDKINKIKDLADKYNQLEISEILGMAQSTVHLICACNHINCAKSKQNLKDESLIKPRTIVPRPNRVKKEPIAKEQNTEAVKKPVKTPQQIMAEAFREQADSIRNKLNKQYKREENNA